MAEEREPPPFDEEVDLFGEKEEEDDIFKPVSTKTSEPEKPTSGDTTSDNETESKSEPAAAIAPELEKEPEPVVDEKVSEPVKSVAEEASDDEDMFKSAVTHQTSKSADASQPEPEEPLVTEKPKTEKSEEQLLEEAEGDDKFNIEVTINKPIKVGDGMSAYLQYQVNTVTNIPAFRKNTFAVKRRFSDFLGLQSSLVGKHQQKGVIVPKPPEKSTIGMAKVKMSKEESGGQNDFIEKRRASLERYMNRTASHPTLRMDPDFRDFLTLDAELPKASSTSALSAAGVKRFFGKVGDAVSKMSSNIPETDPWFEEKMENIESMETVLHKLHDSADLLVSRRQALVSSTHLFAQALAVLASADENVSLGQHLSKLSNVQDKIQQIQEEQLDSDFFTMSELLKDYLSQISAIKDVFNERVKIFKTWKDAEAMLTKKREAKVKIELSNKTDKLPQATEECEEWEENVKKGEKNFDQISQALKQEMGRFNQQRVRDFKAKITNYIERLLNNEEKLTEYWEEYLPDLKAAV